DSLWIRSSSTNSRSIAAQKLPAVRCSRNRTATREGGQEMRIQLKATASAIGLFAVLTAAIGANVDVAPDDMHWPTTGSVMATGDDMHWPTSSGTTSTDDMHWPT